MSKKVIEGVDENSYLKGYKNGFFAAMTVCLALAKELLITVDNNNKVDVEEFIEKLRQ